MDKCYICRCELKQQHPFYHRLCHDCGEYNLNMRMLTMNLTGMRAVVTGGRIKIGRHTALKLLRAGAEVIITTRFPMGAIESYSQEPDFELWRDRLTVCELNMKRIGDVELFAEYVASEFKTLDIIVNNAAQTIKKSREYYTALEEEEQKLRRLTGRDHSSVCLGFIRHDRYPVPQSQSIINLEETDDYNSWVAKPEDISLYEFLEVQIINSTAPFMLCTRLKECLCRSNNLNKFIINVASMEGSFIEKKKSDKHIHTNMAKASLNMLTKSLGRSWAKDRIYVYSVDPGWVSNQFPAKWNGVCDESFEAPLTYEDAASRLCYPIFKYADREKVDEYGIVYKNYKKEDW